jgi:hypothetical protein
MKKLFVATLLLIVVFGLQSPTQNASAVTTWPPLNQSVGDNNNTAGIWISWDHNPGLELSCSGCYPNVLVQVKAPGSSSFVKLRNFTDDKTSYLYQAGKPGEEYEFKIGYCYTSQPACTYFNPYGTDGSIHTGVRRLSAPTSLTASDGTSSTGIELDWDTHPQESASGFYYQIYISTTGDPGTYALGPGVTTSSYSDTSMDPLAYRYYKIKACIDRCGGADYATGYRGLPAPENLIVTDDTTGVYLDWEYVQNATYYQVSRSTNEISWEEVASPSVSAYADTGGSYGVEFSYRIRACASSPSTCGSYVYGTGLRGIYPPVISTEPLLGGGIQINWTHADPGETTNYWVFRAHPSTPTTFDLIASEPIANGLSYTDSTAVIDTNYIYKLRACRASPLTCSDFSNAIAAKWSTCYQLTLNVEGQGAVPNLEPTHSAGCPSGNSLLYSEGEDINFFNYNPNFGWHFDHWTGTFASDSDVAIMPASDHVVTAHYVENGTPGGLIFSDDFESGDFSQWFGVNTGGGYLYTCTKAAMNGTYGACVQRGSTSYRKQLVDNSPKKDTSLSVQFNFDIHSLSMGVNDPLHVLKFKKLKEVPAYVVIKHNGSQYLIRLITKLDDLTKVKTSWITLTDAPHTIEVDWQAASVAGANDGFAKLYIDNVLQEALTDLDNDTLYITHYGIGFTNLLTGLSISGIVYFDDVLTSNNGYIGAP